ncbi:MAG TPA: serine/threonine-protein kinase [Candidatus Obscuribacter sp.]|nr:serine/threonine-protein kinase [Candidatus Obscuribacter sp.]HNB14522.1 serine/threonine-protein kinase [Candidatus Obscuribacter sp.]HND05843.1 serine/threonine-protein kinase [Candidatus Obscuribacter sp.]HND65976.1 serine/threonine-protein kinase [Candidatus Obscuribacter sp.]HNG20032.1 serine/threonine-protein kinase [Candidatus Obscuribacter sp.]
MEEELQKTTFSETDGGAPLMRDTKLVQSVVYSLPEKYEVLERLGRGGMGTVFKARHKDLDEVVAIKVINPELVEKEGEATSRRFLAEAKAASRLNHPNLIGLKDYGVTSEGAAYMVMEFVQGESLEDYLKRRGKLEVNEALQIALGICDGLTEAHSKGLVHRDVKPANVILSCAAGAEGQAGINFQPKILDFGIARISTADGRTQGLTATGEVFGSPLYIAPEQSMSSKVDQRADLYSLGCLLFEMVTGRPPFLGENAIQTIMMHLNSPVPSATLTLGYALPGGLSQVIARCMDKTPARRYQSVAELKQELELILSGKSASVNTAPGVKGGSGEDGRSGKFEQARKVARPASAASEKAGRLVAFGIIATVSLTGLLVASQFVPFFFKGGSTGAVGNVNQAFKGGAGAITADELVEQAKQMDMTKALEAYQKGDYQSSAIMLKGAVSVYDDALIKVKKELERTKRGRRRQVLREYIAAVESLKAENLNHVGECYKHMGRAEDAIQNYRNAIEVFKPYSMNGTANPYIDNSYQSSIELLKQSGQTEAARLVEQDWELVKSRRQ